MEYLKQYHTDYFEMQVQDCPVVIEFTEEEIKRWEDMSPRSLPKVPRTIKPWSETEYRRRESKKLWCGIALILVVFVLILWALVGGA